MIAINPHESTASTMTIVRDLLLALEIPGLTAAVVQPDASLLELGLDSVSFAELTLGLEDALHIDRFPMQDWVDDQLEAGLPLSVGSLVNACVALTGGARQ